MLFAPFFAGQRGIKTCPTFSSSVICARMAAAVLTGGFSGVVEDGAVDCVGGLDDVGLFEDVVWLEVVD